MEVFDLESDVVVYDVEQHKILSAASLITKDAFETFPAFSPDGKWLYFCSAPACEMPADYDKVRYHICRLLMPGKERCSCRWIRWSVPTASVILSHGSRPTVGS